MSGLTADLLLVNGRVLTMDARNATAEAVAVRDGKIVAVGTGRLTDCHVHLASDASRAVDAVECRDLYDSAIDSVGAIVSRIRHWTESTPPGEWIIARGSPLADCRLAERRLPTKVELHRAHH